MRSTFGALLLGFAAVCAADDGPRTALAPLVRSAVHGDATALASLTERGLAGEHRALLALARMRIDGVGVARDERAGFGWLCLAVHHDVVTQDVARSVWLLAEWFRTGGGIADRLYAHADLDREDPLRAYFWYAVLARIGARDVEGGARAAKLARVGERSVGRMLFEAEREAMSGAAHDWNPSARPVDGETCLALPAAAG